MLSSDVDGSVDKHAYVCDCASTGTNVMLLQYLHLGEIGPCCAFGSWIENNELIRLFLASFAK